MKLTYGFAFHSGQYHWQTYECLCIIPCILCEGERNHHTKIPSQMCLEWETTGDGAHFCSEFLAICSPASQGVTSTARRSLLTWNALWSSVQPVKSCTACAWASGWVRDRQDSSEPSLENLNLNNFKCNPTQVQHFCLAARWEEKYEKATCHWHGSSLFSPPPLPPREVCSFAPAGPAQAWAQASATASWSKGHVSRNKRCKTEPLAFRAGEISGPDLNSSN